MSFEIVHLIIHWRGPPDDVVYNLYALSFVYNLIVTYKYMYHLNYMKTLTIIINTRPDRGFSVDIRVRIKLFW